MRRGLGTVPVWGKIGSTFGICGTRALGHMERARSEDELEGRGARPDLADDRWPTWRSSLRTSECPTTESARTSQSHGDRPIRFPHKRPGVAHHALRHPLPLPFSSPLYLLACPPPVQRKSLSPAPTTSIQPRMPRTARSNASKSALSHLNRSHRPSFLRHSRLIVSIEPKRVVLVQLRLWH